MSSSTFGSTRCPSNNISNTKGKTDETSKFSSNHTIDHDAGENPKHNVIHDQTSFYLLISPGANQNRLVPVRATAGARHAVQVRGGISQRTTPTVHLAVVHPIDAVRTTWLRRRRCCCCCCVIVVILIVETVRSLHATATTIAAGCTDASVCRSAGMIVKLAAHTAKVGNGLKSFTRYHGTPSTGVVALLARRVLLCPLR